MKDLIRNQVVLVDKNDGIMGLKEKFAAHKNPVPLHRAISVVIFSPDRKKMLIQKRAETKPTWPLFWSNTVCSHPYKDEDYAHAASRRLKEEMGFSTSLKELYRFIYEAEMDKTWGEHELDAVFVGTYSGEVNPDPNESADYKWIEVDELKKDMKENPQIYTPWFIMILKKVL